ncbi:MAG: TRAP transporter substrate-binding protein [Rhodospirillales bacterium]|nr:TRAP transporter substrate-binding protein [Rhodospirillales bacterium]
MARAAAWLALASALGAALGLSATPAPAGEARHFTFGYDQPHTTGYGVVGDIFNDTLSRLSGGTMAIDQFPGAQLGQEPQMLQKIRTGDIDFIIASTANSATVAPESGVMSIHYLFRSEAGLVRALADPKVTAAVRAMFDANVKGAHVLSLCTLGLRNLYGRKEIHTVADMVGLKVRVQATPTEDTMFPAYGAQVVHMPFGSVYTSLQTGVMDAAENGIDVYLANKHYEVAPVMSLSEHEANNCVIWVSDRLWLSLTPQQQGWVQAAADEVAARQPQLAVDLDHQAAAKLRKIGVRFVDVDKSGFIKVAEPLQDKIAAGLGPHAVEILHLVRADQ